MATFQEIRGHNPALIRKALAGAVFAKRWDEDDPEITTVWTAAEGLAVPDGYVSVGLTSKDDAVTNSRDVENNDVTSWGYGEPTRSDITSDTNTLQFTMQESSLLAAEIYYNADYSEVTADTDNNVILDKPATPEPINWRFFVLSQDGAGANAIYWLEWLPYCRVTSVEDLVDSEADELKYTVTLTGFSDPEVLTARRVIWGGPGFDPEKFGITPPDPGGGGGGGGG